MPENVKQDDYWSQFEDVESAKVQGTTPKFKLANAGDKARIHFPFVNPKNQQVALKKVVYFNFEDKATKSWARFQAPDKDSKAYKIAVQHCGEPQTSYVTPILQYATNNAGRVISGIDYKVLAMTLHKTRMQELKQIQEEYNLAEIDLAVVCNNVDYQNLKFSPLRVCALSQGFVTIKDRNGLEKKITLDFKRDEVFAQAKEVMNDADLVIASRWGEQQIIDFFMGDKGITKGETPAFEATGESDGDWGGESADSGFDADEDVF